MMSWHNLVPELMPEELLSGLIASGYNYTFGGVLMLQWAGICAGIQEYGTVSNIKRCSGLTV